MSITSDFFSIFFSGYIMEKLGSRISLLICYMLALIGGISMLAYGLDNPDSAAFPVFFLICRSGIRGADLIYVAANSRVFDIEQASTAFGLGSFFGRIVVSSAPTVSTVSQPVPMVIFTTMALASSVSSFLLKIHPEAETCTRKPKIKKEQPAPDKEDKV